MLILAGKVCMARGRAYVVRVGGVLHT